MARSLRLLSGVAAVLALSCPVARAAAFGPLPPRNPYTAANGAATMHADSESSNASPYPGPGAGAEQVQEVELGAACPTILQGSDGMPVALCTTILGQNPTLYLLDPSTGLPLTSMSLPKGNLFGGVYAYIDQDNRVVLFNADGDLLRIGHQQTAPGHWELTVDSSIPIAPAVDKVCPSVCGGVVGLAPDWQGRVWFATAQGVAGFVNPSTNSVQAIALGHGEQVANSISTAPEGTAVATDHALYLLGAGATGQAKILWRYAYDRGSARKPGQLSQGTGSTPTFFGAQDGTRYLAFTDNAAPAEHLIVVDTRAEAAKAKRPAKPKRRKRRHKHAKAKARGQRHRVMAHAATSRTKHHNKHKPKRHKKRKPKPPHTVATSPHVVCDIPVLTPGPSGTENNPVGSGHSVFLASTYGYPYPSLPAGAQPSQPASAPFTGGVTRVDLNSSGSGCKVVWQDSVRSSAVPRLDVNHGLLYTVGRASPNPLDPDDTTDTDTFSSVAIDAATGAIEHTTLIGAAYLSDTLQLAPTIVPGDVLYQGTISGLVRISPAPSVPTPQLP